MGSSALLFLGTLFKTHILSKFFTMLETMLHIIYLCSCWVCCLPPYETDYQEDGVRSLSFTPVSPVPRTVPGTNRCSIRISWMVKWTFLFRDLIPFYNHIFPDVGRLWGWVRVLSPEHLKTMRFPALMVEWGFLSLKTHNSKYGICYNSRSLFSLVWEVEETCGW